MNKPDVDCMACIVNSAAGCPHKRETVNVLGVTHWLTLVNPLDNVPTFHPTCLLARMKNGGWWLPKEGLTK